MFAYQSAGKSRQRTSAEMHSMAVGAAGRTLLIVDDEKHILRSLSRLLRKRDYKVLTASSASEALDLLEREPVQVAVLDYWMPGMDGVSLARRLSDEYPEVVKIMLTGCIQLEVVKEAVKRGEILRYLVKPWDELELISAIEKAFQAFESGESLEQSDIERAAGMGAVPHWARKMLPLARTVEVRDPYILGHSHRVARLSARMGAKLDMSDSELNELKLGALLHDIGKLSVPDAVLFKPDRLDEEETRAMRMHPTAGREMLQGAGAPLGVMDIVALHHENWDGSGYPNGIGGKDLPISARIIRLADAFDAMKSKRPYRDGLPMDIIRREVEKNSGTQFDPALAPLFLELLE